MRPGLFVYPRYYQACLLHKCLLLYYKHNVQPWASTVSRDFYTHMLVHATTLDLNLTPFKCFHYVYTSSWERSSRSGQRVGPLTRTTYPRSWVLFPTPTNIKLYYCRSHLVRWWRTEEFYPCLAIALYSEENAFGSMLNCMIYKCARICICAHFIATCKEVEDLLKEINIPYIDISNCQPFS